MTGSEILGREIPGMNDIVSLFLIKCQISYMYQYFHLHDVKQMPGKEFTGTQSKKLVECCKEKCHLGIFFYDPSVLGNFYFLPLHENCKTVMISTDSYVCLTSVTCIVIYHLITGEPFQG